MSSPYLHNLASTWMADRLKAASAAMAAELKAKLPREKVAVAEPHPPMERLMTLEELGSWLGVSPSTMYRLVRKGKLPVFKVGRSWKCRRDTFEHWFAEQEHR